MSFVPSYLRTFVLWSYFRMILYTYVYCSLYDCCTCSRVLYVYNCTCTCSCLWLFIPIFYFRKCTYEGAVQYTCTTLYKQHCTSGICITFENTSALPYFRTTSLVYSTRTRSVQYAATHNNRCTCSPRATVRVCVRLVQFNCNWLLTRKG